MKKSIFLTVMAFVLVGFTSFGVAAEEWWPVGPVYAGQCLDSGHRWRRG